MPTKNPKKYPKNGPSLADQQTVSAYWLKPQEAAKLAKQMRDARGTRR